MVTIDTNIAFYAMSLEDKRVRAREVLRQADFLSVQVLNEYASAARRKLRRDWGTIAGDLSALRTAGGAVRPLTEDSHRDAVRLAERYQLQFYDALIAAVALENRAATLFSEDMQHGLVVDGKLTITNPFVPAGA